MHKASPRGILSPDRLVLTPRQRQEFLRLRARGVPESTARELAFAFDKSALACETNHIDREIADLALSTIGKEASHYERRFVDGAKRTMADAAFSALHAQARGSAGGHARAQARATAAQTPEERLKALWEQRRDLTAQMQALDAQIAGLPMGKAITPAGTVHVDRPVDGKPPKKRRGKDREKVGKQLGVSPNMTARTKDYVPSPDVAAPSARMADAARLVAGMDWETRLGANGVDDARARASRTLGADMTRYDRIFVSDPELRGVRGFDVDVGCGSAREPGFLGLDLYPYDYGVALHDIGLGLPFPDASLRSVRLVNALEYMPDFGDDATPLLAEIQRALNYGGKFYYEGVGDLEELADFGQLPGLVLVEHEDTQPTMTATEPTESQLHRQVFERVRVRVPQVYGANPEWLGQDENSMDDLQYALAAMGVDVPAEYAMADLFGKSQGVPPPKGVQSACRRGLDLAPEYGGAGLTDGAKARARSMASGNAVSPQNLKRMKSFFARHAADKKADWSNPPTPGYVAWLLWGGDAGASWASAQVDRMDKADKKKPEKDKGRGRKPMGAAYARARASDGSQSDEAVRRRANAYLREQGHDPVGKTMAMRLEGAVPMIKSQEDWQQIFYCVIYSPNELDTDGEYIEPACIEKMAHQAMLDRVPILFEHQGEPIRADLVESYVAPQAFEFRGRTGPQTIRKGAWVGGFSVQDKDVWQMILDGKIKGVSVGGLAAKEQR